MNIAEALSQRIPRVRQPEWANQAAYLRLPLLANGLVGAWAELYDEIGQRDVLDIKPGSQKIPTFLSQDEGFEAYTGAISEYEADVDNFAKTYTES